MSRLQALAVLLTVVPGVVLVACQGPMPEPASGLPSTPASSTLAPSSGDPISREPISREPISRDEVQQVLDSQAKAWNAGDLRGFMATYARDPELTFMGTRGITHGWEHVLAGYEKGYPDAASRGRLSFELLEVRPLGTQWALVLGRFELLRDKPAAGYFTLLLARTSQGLKIVHDHTS